MRTEQEEAELKALGIRRAALQSSLAAVKAEERKIHLAVAERWWQGRQADKETT